MKEKFLVTGNKQVIRNAFEAVSPDTMKNHQSEDKRVMYNNFLNPTWAIHITSKLLFFIGFFREFFNKIGHLFKNSSQAGLCTCS
ncbi:hypothetical protein SAMN06296241_1423 [Salinimicrobium sediminis]|uniref:Uncharacterized protein n=1 Tax=Salinimicrobium sediminis TaxID=1343891 RepID=A0A285X531_9FLAO|nr:hypothetical protein SAMN06296241_1423 [Salinimicrobium sediminis]